MSDEEIMVSGSQVANHYQVNEGSVRRWRREGMPCHWYNSKLVRYKLSEVEGWLKARGANIKRTVVIPPHERRKANATPVVTQ